MALICSFVAGAVVVESLPQPDSSNKLTAVVMTAQVTNGFLFKIYSLAEFGY